jgi:hypothetical protein
MAKPAQGKTLILSGISLQVGVDQFTSLGGRPPPLLALIIPELLVLAAQVEQKPHWPQPLDGINSQVRLQLCSN